MAKEKIWTHEGPSEKRKKRKKVGHMKVQEKKEKIAMSTKESKEREKIMQNGVTTNYMVITSTHLGLVYTLPSQRSL
jgi:hypothetical protein